MFMKITRRTVAKKLAAYLHHELSLAALVAWAETAMHEGAFDERHADTLASAIGRLGVADADGFALTWEDCEKILAELGYSARIAIVAA
jgi:hypothetical protein